MLASVCKSGYPSPFAALVGGCLISMAAWATTIDFNGLPGNQGWPFTSYTEAGFTVAPLSGSWLVGENYGHPPPFIFFKHPAAEGATTTASVAITSGGATFRFDSLDIYSSVTPVPYVFTGLLDAQTVFTISGTVPLPYGNFTTVPNPYRADLIDTLQVTLSTFTQYPVGNAVGVDNVVVNLANSSVAEPRRLLLFGAALAALALAALALVRRRSSRVE